MVAAKEAYTIHRRTTNIPVYSVKVVGKVH